MRLISEEPGIVVSRVNWGRIAKVALIFLIIVAIWFAISAVLGSTSHPSH